MNMTMCDYCLEQPKALKGVLASRTEYMDSFVRRFLNSCGQIEFI